MSGSVSMRDHNVSHRQSLTCDMATAMTTPQYPHAVSQWQVKLDGGWVDFDEASNGKLNARHATGKQVHS